MHRRRGGFEGFFFMFLPHKSSHSTTRSVVRELRGRGAMHVSGAFSALRTEDC